MTVFTPGGRCLPSHTELKHRCDKLQRLLKAKDAVIEDYSTKRRVSQQNRLARMSSHRVSCSQPAHSPRCSATILSLTARSRLHSSIVAKFERDRFDEELLKRQVCV
jgi:hypothetical protein